MRTLLYLYILTQVLRKADSRQRRNDLSVETQGGGVGRWVERDRRQSEGDVALCWQLLYISGEEGAAHRAVPALLPSIRYCKETLHCGVVRRGDFPSAPPPHPLFSTGQGTPTRQLSGTYQVHLLPPGCWEGQRWRSRDAIWHGQEPPTKKGGGSYGIQEGA